MIHQLTKFFIFLFFNKYEKRVAFLLKYKRILILNFIVQRIFGNSAILKYSLHYTSKINTDKNGLIIENDSSSFPAFSSPVKQVNANFSRGISKTSVKNSKLN